MPWAGTRLRIGIIDVALLRIVLPGRQCKVRGVGHKAWPAAAPCEIGARQCNGESPLKLQAAAVIANLIEVKRGSYKRTPAKEACKRSPCAISCALDLLGDKWTLLVIRDLLWFDKHLYNELQQSPEKIPTNTLAERLKRLEEAGVITRKAYQQHPVRYAYRLTPMGTALHSILKEMAVWSLHHLPYTSFPDDLRRRFRI